MTAAAQHTTTHLAFNVGQKQNADATALQHAATADGGLLPSGVPLRPAAVLRTSLSTTAAGCLPRTVSLRRVSVGSITLIPTASGLLPTVTLASLRIALLALAVLLLVGVT